MDVLVEYDERRPAARRSHGRVGRVATSIVAFAVTAGGLGGALARSVETRIGALPRVDVAGALDPMGDSPVENYLLVGSDSRAGADPDDRDFGSIGDDNQTTGRRSDTVMVLRIDRSTNAAAVLSLPRDLWVPIGGDGPKNRLNAAYSEGPEVLVATVRRSLGIPVHHYVEVGFQGFKQLVDAVGGVEVCFLHPTRDANTGLDVEFPGCWVLDGVQGLQYARSRYYEEFRDGEWRLDGTADIGRIGRQQAFVDIAARQVAEATAANPFRVGRVLDALASATLVDPSFDLLELARRLRPVVADGVVRYTLPVDGDEIDGKSVLVLRNEALAVISFFQGGPVPS